MSKMGDLHYTLTLDTDPVERKLKIIGKHLTAMVDELELAGQLEGMDFKVHANAAAAEHVPYVQTGCGSRRPLEDWGKSCLPKCTCIDKVADEVIRRLRDFYGLEV